MAEYYRAVKCLDHNACTIRSLPEKNSDPSGKPPQRTFGIFIGKMIEPYCFKLLHESGNNFPIDVTNMTEYLVVSVNGGHICMYSLPVGKIVNEVEMHNSVKLSLGIDDEVMELIIGWIS